MSDQFIGEIRIFAGNFPPRSWAYCDGQVLSISSNDSLFSLLGTIYGGDGRTTFGLPDLQGRAPIHWGSGPGLTTRRIGQRSGQETVTLTINEMPGHTHDFYGNDAAAGGTTAAPQGKVPAKMAGLNAFASGTANRILASTSITDFGGSQKHENMMPFLCVHFIIALYGVYPSRS